MSYKATVDVVIALNTFKISSFRRQGKLRFLLSLSQLVPSNTHNINNKQDVNVCTPYNLYKQNKNLQHQLQRSHAKGLGMSIAQEYFIKKPQNNNEESFIDNDEECYYSRVFASKYQSQNHLINDCCFFKAYVGVDKLEQTKLKMKIVLLFCPEEEDMYIEVRQYESIIHKIANVCTYFPAIFDEFGGLQISGSYQSTIMDYKFQMNTQIKNKYDSFAQYFYAATLGLNRQKIQQFYSYYRKSLQNQLFSIQEKHSDLLRILNISTNYGFIKVSPNQNLRQLLSFFENTRGLSRSRSGQNLHSIDQWTQKLCDQIICDFNGLKGIIHQKWNEFIIFLSEHLELVGNYLRKQYQSHVYERLRSNVFSHQVQSKWDWTFSRYEDSGKQLLKQAQMDKQKKKDEELWRQYFPIENKQDFQEQGKTIKIFQQIYQGGFHRRALTMQPTRKGSFDNLSYSTVSNQAEYLHNYRSYKELHLSKSLVGFPQQFNNFSQKTLFPQQNMFAAKKIHFKTEQEQNIKMSGQHIIVFVHGYQASRQDFVLFKACLQLKYKCRVFISSANEGHTQQSIQNLGKRLAIELNNFFKNIQFGPSTRLSFIGHSMGGIIIRSALSYIRNIDQYLWSYLSFSSPHLGYLYQPSAIVQAGLWLLGTINKSQSLDQLCMRDSTDPRKCLLYRLSQNGSLNGFQYLAFISSSQDEYVPYQSARIQKNSHLLSKLGYQSISGNVIREMVDGLLAQSRCRQISRMNVVFNIQGSNFDAFVGRTAHIKYLSDHKFIKMFSTVFDKYFS